MECVLEYSPYKKKKKKKKRWAHFCMDNHEVKVIVQGRNRKKLPYIRKWGLCETLKSVTSSIVTSSHLIFTMRNPSLIATTITPTHKHIFSHAHTHSHRLHCSRKGLSFNIAISSSSQMTRTKLKTFTIHNIQRLTHHSLSPTDKPLVCHFISHTSNETTLVNTHEAKGQRGDK